MQILKAKAAQAHLNHLDNRMRALIKQSRLRDSKALVKAT